MTTFTLYRFDELPLNTAYEMLTLRHTVFVVETGWPIAELDGLDPVCLHLLAVDSGVLVGCARIVPPGVAKGEHRPALGRVAVARTRRGEGLGKALVARALAELEKLYPGQAIALSAREHLSGFYQAFGFEIEGDPHDVVGMPHIAMAKRPDRTA